MAGPGFDAEIYVNSREVERAMRKVAPEVLKSGRREMAQLARSGRDEIRGGVPYSKLRTAVTSGTRGLNPALKLNRQKTPWTAGHFFGAKGDRYPQFPRAKPGGYYFYPKIKEIRPEATNRYRAVLDDVLRRSGLK